MSNFAKFTSVINKPVHIKKELVSAVTTDASGITVICQNGEMGGFQVKETPEEVIKAVSE